MKRVTVKQDEQAPISVEVLAQEIVALSAGIKKLRGGRLNDRALILLIQHATAPAGTKYNKKTVSQHTVKAVLDGIESLEREYIRNPTK